MTEDLVPIFDFDAPQNPDIKNYRDASAAAVVASGLLELVNYVDEQKAKEYRNAALTILENLSSVEYFAKTGENGHFLLKHSTGHYPHNDELDVAINYADYYFLEALLRCTAQTL